MVPVSWCVQGWGFQPRPMADGMLLRGPDLVGLIGLNRDWLERDPDSGERNAPSNEKSGNLSGNFSDPAQNFRFLEKEKYRQHIESEELFLVS